MDDARRLSRSTIGFQDAIAIGVKNGTTDVGPGVVPPDLLGGRSAGREGEVLLVEIQRGNLARARGRHGDVEAALVEGREHPLVLEERQLLRPDQAVELDVGWGETARHGADDPVTDTDDEHDREAEGDEASGFCVHEVRVVASARCSVTSPPVAFGVSAKLNWFSDQPKYPPSVP